jgi:hypothetical protein
MTLQRLLSRAAQAVLLLAAPISSLATPAAADAPVPPTFTIQNQSGLTAAQAKFYYLGAGQDVHGNFIVLMPNGTWAIAGSTGTGWNPTGWNPNQKLASGAGVVPCYQVQGGEQITIPLDALSMRVYVFMARKGSSFYNVGCNTSPAATGVKQVNGIFGTYMIAGQKAYDFAPFSYSILTGNGAYAGLKLSKMKAGKIPPWSFAEIGYGDIDTSQVDAIAFPLNITAKMTEPAGTTYPVSDQGVGFSFSSQGQVNMKAVITSYNGFVATLPKLLLPSLLPVTPRASYKKLLVSYPGGKFLTNPGNYLGFISQNDPLFANVFLNLVNNYLWKNWTGTIDVGGVINGLLLQTQFAGEVKTLTSYPGYKAPLSAIKFTGRGVSAYVLSPASYQVLCKAGAIPGNCGYMTPAYQIFATDGALNTPIDGNQFALLTPEEKAAWEPYHVLVNNESDHGLATYNQVVARLGFIMSMALNHGVAGGLQSPGGLCGDTAKYPIVSACWSDQTLWYPNPNATTDSTKFFRGDKTQNEFARWLHTAQIGTGSAAIPMMTRPNNPTTTASGVMGMGYGFASDENPTPPFDISTMSQTPSEYSGNVAMETSSNCNFITIMPMVPGGPNASPVHPSCASDD